MATKVCGNLSCVSTLMLTLGVALGCSSGGPASEEAVESTPQALTSGGTSNANLQLQVLTNTCGATQTQQFFQIVNSTSAAVKLSDLQIKFWLDDTSASAIVAAFVSTPGCVSKAGNPSCVHLVPSSKATITATKLSSACGPDANHQANWEITISYTDTYAIPAGGMVTNVQTALHLSNYGNFTPGTSGWYSPCLTGTSYAANNHFALYYQGNLVIPAGISAPDCRSPHGTQRLTGQIPPAMASAPLVGPVPAATPISVSVRLQLKTPSQDLVDFANQVSDPYSPSYRHYLTVDGFRDKFGATPENYAKVQSWATSRGLTVKTFPNNLVIGVTGTASAIQQAFYVNLNYYLRGDGTKFYGPDREPSVDTEVPLLYIGHLNNLFVSKPALPPNGSGQASTTGNLYIGDDFRNAYAWDKGTGMQTTLTGSDQCVGLFGGEGFSLADMNAYWKNAGRSLVNMPLIKAVNADNSSTYQPCNPLPINCDTGGAVCGAGTDKDSTGVRRCRADLPADMHCCGIDWTAANPSVKECFGGCPPNSGCDTAHMGTSVGAPTDSACPSSTNSYATEMTLDIQMAMAMAPGSQIYVFVAGDGEQALSQMANSTPLCNQLSSSWGLDVTLGSLSALLEFASKGQSFFHGSGDWGPLPWDGLIAQPNLTAVGGTVLSMTPPGKTYLTESASTLSGGWVANGAVSDGCGKFPAAIPIPDYQLGVTTGNGASNTYRNVPDVAMPSDFVEIDLNLAPIGVGGTSASGPLWAGFMALVNQQCSINQLGPVGFANPALYSIARTRGTTSDTYGTSFHDVMGGANHVYGCTPPNPAPGCQCSDSGTNGNSAGIGYDLVTGLGSPRFELIGQLASTTPVSVLDVSTGEALTCIVRSNHTVMCWGFNGPAIGALGNGSSVDNSDVPVTVTGITTAARVSVGGFHACALLQNGAVQCWGNNDRGQLGNGTTVNSSVPTQVSGLSAATGISAVGAYPWGGEHTCAVLASGEVMCWGANSSGQLGDGTTFDRSAPVLVAGIGGAAGVSAGGTDTCAWLKAGGVRCWGSNQQGQLGNGTTTASLVPVPVSASALGNGVTPVSASGEDYNCALRGDGVVLCWGGNQFGALGIGTTDDSWVPVPVSGITSATNVSAGIFHACAALKDGTIRCWGEDDALGNGSTATGVSTNPVEVTALSTATWVAAGYSYSCAISPTALSCWGLNYEGQLGIGSVYNSFVPATVHFF